MSVVLYTIIMLSRAMNDSVDISAQVRLCQLLAPYSLMPSQSRSSSYSTPRSSREPRCSSADSSSRSARPGTTKEAYTQTRSSRSASAPAPVGRHLPPAASSAGKKYYSLCTWHRKGAVICAGQDVALSCIKTWVAGPLGRSPKGFACLEDAINVCQAHHGVPEVVVRTTPWI